MPKFPYNPFDSSVGFGRKFIQWINNVLKDIGSDLKENKARVDNLIRNAPQPSEVVDLRVDADGVEHATAGDRITKDYDTLTSQYVYLTDTVDIQVKDINQKILESKRSFAFGYEFEHIAHRGFSGVAPESTIAAFIEAINAGFNSLETDVQISADGVPVCIHDDTVDRTTNGSGLVKAKTLSQLQSLDASKLKPYYSGAKIPTFEEYLEVCKGHCKYIYPEIKSYRSQNDISLIVDLIVKHGWETKCIIQSFRYDDLRIVRNLNPSITLGYLLGDLSTFNNALDKIKTDGNGIILSEYTFMLNNPSLVEVARKEGIDIAVWTVDSAEIIQRLKKIGITRVMSNYKNVGW
ncbi:hypothetical protein JF536_11535 [Priestia flexa]|uniref:glycerophosphodiester phosphodiesterase n=1 Tax=Priestia flexa TaxID=86664 RepID=UPI001A8D5E6F|nr:glycerophosphodiester phosphodiesterase family protein [Priestia flexa]MBN8434728.1 hypothetical protein [Priestia flexa]MCA0967266.1 hypothetical protein [Priestia flexa]